MDALWYEFVLRYHGDAIAYGVVGALVPLLMGRTIRERAVGLAAAAGLSVVAVLVMKALSA